MATALPVAPSSMLWVTCSAAIGQPVPIPVSAFGKTTFAFLIVAVPVVAPKLNVVAAAPIARVVGVANIVPEELVVVIVPLFAARFAVDVILPVAAIVPS